MRLLATPSRALCLSLLALAVASVGGCAVVTVTGAAVGAAITVTGAVVSTGVEVTGKVIGAGIGAVTGADDERAK